MLILEFLKQVINTLSIYFRQLKGEPAFIVGDKYLIRWWLIPRNPIINIYLHTFVGSDDDRALHDHPWWSVSFLLSGEMIEVRKDKPMRVINKWFPIFRSSKFLHRLILTSETASTIFITGPVIRNWGFYCEEIKKWIPWKEFVDSRDKGEIGRGCGEY